MAQNSPFGVTIFDSDADTILRIQNDFSVQKTKNFASLNNSAIISVSIYIRTAAKQLSPELHNCINLV